MVIGLLKNKKMMNVEVKNMLFGAGNKKVENKVKKKRNLRQNSCMMAAVRFDKYTLKTAGQWTTI